MSDVQLTTSTRTEVVSRWGSVAVDLRRERCTVRLVGEIDANLPWDDVQGLAQAVRSAGRPVEVDCSAVTFFGSEGLGVLALLREAAPDGHLASLVASPVVRLVLDLYPDMTFTGDAGS